MFSRQASPSHGWSASPRENPVHRQTQSPSSTSGHGYIPPSQGRPRPNSSPPPNPMNDRLIQLIEALHDRIAFLERQLVAPHKRRLAHKNARNSVVRARIDPVFAEPLSRYLVLDQCQRANYPLNLVFAVQRPKLAPENEVLLIVRSDDDAARVRAAVDQFKHLFGAESFFCPESFYITPSAFSKEDLKQMSAGPRAKHDYWGLFKDPNKNLKHWSIETGLDIKGAHWNHGFLWLVLHSVDDARRAVSENFFSSLCGFQTTFMSRDPRSIPMQCFNCYDLGHMASRCPHEVPRCGYCASEHMTSECQTETAKKKCVICMGPHEGYRLNECRHPRVIDALEKCRLWRGPAHWDRPAASNVQSDVFEGEYTDIASTGSPVDAFPYHFADQDDEDAFFRDDSYIDEPVQYDTASPWHPTSSPDEGFNNHVEFSTAGLVLPPTPYPSGGTTAPFNRAPGTPLQRDTPFRLNIGLPPGPAPDISGSTMAPVQRTPSPSPSETSLGSRASLVECLENLPRSSSTRRSSREILDQTVAQIAWEAKRAESQSQSNSWSFSRTDLGSVPESAIDLTTCSTPESDIDLTTGSTPEFNVGSTARSTPESDIYSTAGSTPDSNVDSMTGPDLEYHVDLTTGSTPESAIDLTTRSTPESDISSTAGSTLESAIDLTTGSSESDLSSDNRLDTSSTAGSTLSPLPRPAPDSATQVDSSNTGTTPLILTGPPLVRDIRVTPAKRPAEQDEHSSVRAAMKRVRSEPTIEDTGSEKSLDETWAYPLENDSGEEDANADSEDDIQLEDCHPDEPMTGQGEQAEDCGRSDSPVLAEATSRTSSPTVQHPEISDSATEDTSRLGNRPGSPLSRDAALGSSAETLENAGPTWSSTRVTHSSFLRVEAAAITPETPRHTQTPVEEISPGTSFASTTDSSPRARSPSTTPGTDISSPTWTPTTASSSCPPFRFMASDEDGAGLPTPTSFVFQSADLGQKKGSARKEDARDTSQPQTQSDDHQLESLDRSDLEDAEEDCIIVKVVKAPKRQMSLSAYWRPEPKNSV